MLDQQSWRWGLSLIALTLAFHAAFVVMMGIAVVKLRLRLETRGFVLWHLIPFMICMVTVIGLLLAVAHRVRDLGSGVFMAWRSRLALRRFALFHRLNEYTRRFRAHAATTLAVDGCPGVSQRDATVRY